MDGLVDGELVVFVLVVVVVVLVVVVVVMALLGAEDGNSLGLNDGPDEGKLVGDCDGEALIGCVGEVLGLMLIGDVVVGASETGCLVGAAEGDYGCMKQSISAMTCYNKT